VKRRGKETLDEEERGFFLSIRKRDFREGSF